MKDILTIIYIIMTILSTAFLIYIKTNIILSIFLLFIILLVCNALIGYILSSIQSKALNEECDPEKYLEILDRHEKLMKRNRRVQPYFKINRAAGYIALGDHKRALEFLDEIDIAKIQKLNDHYLIYTINLISCYYALGETDKAEYLYETNLIKLSPFGKKNQIAMDLLIATRYYLQNKYDLSYKILQKLLKEDMNKRQYLGVLYCLAEMDVINGETEQAIKKFNKIIKLGNKLTIVQSSKEMLEKLKEPKEN